MTVNRKYGFTFIIIIFIITIILFSNFQSQNQKSNIYYGPPLEDAVYQEMYCYDVVEIESSIDLYISSDWLGIRITIISDLPSNINIMVSNPAGEETIQLEQQFVEGHSEIAEIRSFNPDEIQYGIEGIWKINSHVENGPVTIIVDRVISFGCPS